MSNRVYNTDKVVDKIGLTNQIKYDKIDVFVDNSNKDNIWGMVYYTEYEKNKPIVKNKIINFLNYQDMVNFLQQHFNGFEYYLQFDSKYQQIFFHYVDYINIDYFLHEGKPKLNYLKLNYNEYINNGFHKKSIQMPVEYEDMFLEIIKKNKNLDYINKYKTDYVNTIDVYDNKRKPFEKKISLDKISKNNESLGEMRTKSIKIDGITTKKKNHIKNLKILVSTVALGTLLVGGYNLVNNVKYQPRLITQKNTALSITDIKLNIYRGRAEEIIMNLLNSNYQDVSLEDIKFVKDYFREINSSNYDSNKSITSINYIDYFADQIYKEDDNIIAVEQGRQVLEKIEELYNDCFKIIDNRTVIDSDRIKKYIDYVTSISFMYDTTVDQRDSGNVKMNTQSITSIYATKWEVEIFNHYPPILKYIILNQLENIMIHNNYQVTRRPSNYFKELDKQDLINEIKDIKANLMEQIKNECMNNNMQK